MNKQLLSIIFLIGLISSASAAAAGTAMNCASTPAASTGVAQCADDGNGTATALDSTTGAGAARCLAGFAFTFVGPTTSQCVVCDGTSWKAVDADSAGALAGAASRPCTPCGTGLQTGTTKAAISDCAACAVTQALNLATKACITIPAGAAASKDPGAKFYTIATDATTTLVVIECDTALGYKKAPNASGKCEFCKSTQAYNTSTNVCAPIPTGNAVVKDGGRAYTYDGTSTYTLISCDDEGGFKKAQNGSACDKCTGQNCGTCGATDLATCDTCKTGFRDSSNTAGLQCTGCTPGCGACTSNASTFAEECTMANDGFYVNGSTKVVGTCPPNSTKCTWDAVAAKVKVTQVAAGYYIKTGSTHEPTLCPEGFTSPKNAVADSADGKGVGQCTLACATSCNTCTTAGADKCDVCKVGFKKDSAATDKALICLALPDTAKHITCKTAVGTTKDDCASCDTEATKRIKDPTAVAGALSWKCVCPAGHADDSDLTTGAVAACRPCDATVSSCDQLQDGTPATTIKCVNTAQVVVGLQCYDKTSTSIPGNFIDKDGQVQKCDATCATCNGSAKNNCISCAPITPPAAAYNETDTLSLLTAWSNGTTLSATTPGVCLQKCEDGYQVTDITTRIACEEASSGKILSLIVLISFIILMF